MKINPLSNPNIIKSYQATKSAPIGTNAPVDQDELAVSKEALSFSKVMAEVESRSVEERARIADIKTAVQKGEYKIDAGLVADRILESVFLKND